ARLDPRRPVHLLGIGGISDIFNGVEQGVDTFDCVHPTRLARHGGALVKAYHWLGEEGTLSPQEHINLRKAQYRLDDRPIDADCACRTCQTFSRGYIHHLLKSQEILACTALTFHNVFFMNSLMAAIRKAIETDTLTQEK